MSKLISDEVYCDLVEKIASEYVADKTYEGMEVTAGVGSTLKGFGNALTGKNVAAAKARVLSNNASDPRNLMGAKGALEKGVARAERNSALARGATAGAIGAGAGIGTAQGLKSRKAEKQASEEMYAAYGFTKIASQNGYSSDEDIINKAIAVFEETQLMKQAAEEIYAEADEYVEGDLMKQAALENYNSAEYYENASIEVLDGYGLLD